MSLRTPLITFAGSFAVVLVVGGLLGGGDDLPAGQAPTPTGARTAPSLRLVVAGLAVGQPMEPYPGVTVTAAPTAAADSARVCVAAPTADWQITDAAWASAARTGYCRTLPSRDGLVTRFDLTLEQQ
jgi:hypothetical protein